MNSFDPELLAALAEGSLAPADAAALEARISGDVAALAELEHQRRALAFVRSSPAAELRDAERTALRTAVASRLGLSREGAGAPAPRRRVAWGAIAVGASALAAVIALAPVVGLIGDGAGDDAMTAADGGTSLEGDVARDAGTLGVQFPPGNEDGADTTPLAPTLAGGEEYPATTVATAYAEGAADPTKVAQDLTLLRDDPEGLQVLAAATDATTPCVAEAIVFLGSDAITWFPYPYPPETQEATLATIEYAVFILGDTGDGTAILVAFAPHDCAVPIRVP